MAEHIIPVPPVGVYQWLLRREFDTEFFRFRFRWNDIVQAWYIDIANGANVRQVYGIRLGTGTDKLRAFKARDVPQGTLNVVDSTGEGVQPTLENFGKTVLLKYIDAPEVVASVLVRAQPASLPGPLPPGPNDPHAFTHEDGGDDLLDITNIDVGDEPALGSVLTYSGGTTATWILPTVPAHEDSHRRTGSDSIIAETLQTGETDTAKVLNPDGTNGLEWNDAASGESAGPFVSFYHTANVDDIDTTTPVIVAWNSDRHGGTPDATYFTYPVATNRVKINTAGKYQVSMKASLTLVNASQDSANFLAELFVNGSTSGLPVIPTFLSNLTGNTQEETISFSLPFTFAVDDEVHMGFRTFSNLSGSAFVRLNANTAEFSITYLGP